MDRQWKYSDTERDCSKYGLCYDCELPYEAFPVEFVIDHEQWELINPTYHKGSGLLCYDCMIERLKIVNVRIVTVLSFSINSNDKEG